MSDAQKMPPPVAGDGNTNSNIIVPRQPPERKRFFATSSEPPRVNPEIFRDAGGFIREFYECGLSCAPYPNAPLIGMTALVACAGLAGQGFRGAGSIWPNVYIVGIGETACGKDAPLRLLADLFARLEVQGRYAGKPKSAAGFQDALLENAVQVFACDEASDLLVGMKARGANAPAAAELAATMLAAFSDSGGFSRRRMLKKTADNDTPKGGWNLQASLVAWTQPALFWDAITERDFDSGLVGRCLIVEADERRRNPRRPDTTIEATPGLVTAGKAILDAGGRETHTGDDMPKPALVTFDGDEARLYAERVQERCDNDYNAARDALDRAAAGRGYEKAVKAALVYAVSENPAEPRLTVRGLQWGEELVNSLTLRLCALARDNLAGSRDEQIRNKLRKELRKRGGEASERDLYRAVSSAKPREVVDALEGLAMRGQVEVVEEPHIGREGRPTGPRYRLKND